MAKATVFSIVLAPELHDAFLAAAEACDRPPAQVMRSLMREFIQRQQAAAALAAEAADGADEGSAIADVNGIGSAGVGDDAGSEGIAAPEAPDPADGSVQAKAVDAPPDAAVANEAAGLPADATAASETVEQPATA